MRMFLATAGSRGDVEPFIALAERALAAGHQVRLAVPETADAAAGIDIVSLGADFSRMIDSQGVSPMRALRSFRSVVRPLMRTVIVAAARAAMEFRPDLIVAHPKVLSAPDAAGALGVPHVVVETAPTLTSTRVFPAAGTTTRNLGPLNRSTYHAGRAAAAMFRAEMADARRLIGTAAAPPPAAATLIPVSPAILARAADWPGSVHMTGPWTRKNQSEGLDPQVARFISGGPFVYAGFGSMKMPGASERGEAAVAAARARGARVLIARGLGGIEVPLEWMGPDVLVVSGVPHDAVLPRASAAIHHGGIGTVQAAMQAGTPSIIVPFVADQPFWADRLRRDGLAPAPIRPRALSAQRLGDALDAIDSYRSRVASIAATMSAEDGTGDALRVLEALR